LLRIPSSCSLICYYEQHFFLTEELLKNKFPCTYTRMRGSQLEMDRPIDPFPCERALDEFFDDLSDKLRSEPLLHKLNWEERKREKLAKENTKEVKEGTKYRCVLCRKAFKGDAFVRKHILNKHKPIVELYLQKQREKETLINYGKDKHKISELHFKAEERPSNRGRGFSHDRFGRRPRGRGRYNNFRGGGRNRNMMMGGPAPPPNQNLDAPLPQKFDRQMAQVVHEEKVRTVRSYSGIGDELAIDDLLDFGFGDFEKAPKFNL